MDDQQQIVERVGADLFARAMARHAPREGDAQDSGWVQTQNMQDPGWVQAQAEIAGDTARWAYGVAKFWALEVERRRQTGAQGQEKTS